MEIYDIIENLYKLRNYRRQSLASDDLLERLNFALKPGRVGEFDCDLAGGTMLWDARMYELFGINSGSFSGTESVVVPEQSLLSTMMDNLPDLIYFKDRESRFTAVNRLFLCRAGFKIPV